VALKSNVQKLSGLHRAANKTSLNQVANRPSVDDEQYANFANWVRQ